MLKKKTKQNKNHLLFYGTYTKKNLKVLLLGFLTFLPCLLYYYKRNLVWLDMGKTQF